jgi:tetratricopeptide (TPR) repeat protein
MMMKDISAERGSVSPWIVLALLCVLILTFGCSENPAVKKQKFLEKGNHYFEQRKFSEASIEYRNALQIDSKFADAYYGLGMAYSELGRWLDAAEALAHTLEFSPNNLNAHLHYGEILLLAGQMPEARSQANEVLARDSKSAAAHLLLGRIQMQLKDYSGASQEFQVAAELVPERAAPYSNLALAQLLLGKREEAQASFLKAVSVEPQQVSNYINLANYYRSANRTSEAEQILRQGMETSDQAVELKLALADLFFAEGRTSEVDELLHAVESDKRSLEGKLYVADFYAQRSLCEAALPRYLEIVPKRVKDGSSIKKLINCYLNLERWADARYWIEEASKRRADDSDLFLYRSQLEMGQKHNRTAISEIQNAIRQNPSKADYHDQLGRIYLTKGDYVAAKSAFSDALRIQPDDVGALVAMADISLQEEDWRVALQYAHEISAYHIWDAEAHLIAGNAYVVSHKLDEAAEEFRLALSLGTRDADANERLGWVLSAQGKYPEAQAAYEASLKLRPDSTTALGGLTATLLHQGRAQQAKARLELQVQRTPQSVALQLLKGRFCQSQNDYSCAEVSFRRALELEPESADGNTALGGLYTATGRISEGMREYQLALGKEPESVLTYMYLAGSYENQGEYGEAQKVYQDALRVDPSFAPAQNNLAWLYLEHGGSLEQALELAERAKTQQPNNPNIADTLAWAYFKKGMYSSAIALLEHSVTQDPRNARFQLHLGMAYFARGNELSGRRALQNALRLGLNHEETEQAQQKLQGSRS